MKKLLIILLFPLIGLSQNQELNWGENLYLAFDSALNSNTIIMIEFMAEWCSPCKKMEKETFSDPNVIKRLNQFILIKIDVDKQQNIAKEYNRNAKKYGGIGIPNILFMDKEKNILHQITGFHNASQLITVLDSLLKK